MCDSPESFENQQNNSNDGAGGGKKGRRGVERERETDVRRTLIVCVNLTGKFL
jgi:hypothetical protein